MLIKLNFHLPNAPLELSLRVFNLKPQSMQLKCKMSFKHVASAAIKALWAFKEELLEVLAAGLVFRPTCDPLRINGNTRRTHQWNQTVRCNYSLVPECFRWNYFRYRFKSGLKIALTCTERSQ